MDLRWPPESEDEDEVGDSVFDKLCLSMVCHHVKVYASYCRNDFACEFLEVTFS